MGARGSSRGARLHRLGWRIGLGVAATMALATMARAQTLAGAPSVDPNPNEPRATRFNVTGAPLEVPLPVREGNRILGEARVRIDTHDAIEVHLGDLADLLKPTLSNEAMGRLTRLGPLDSYAAPSLFETLDVEIAFNAAALEVDLELPLSLLGVRTILLVGERPPLDVPIEKPPFFSALLDYRAALDYVQTDRLSGQEGVRSPIVALDFAGRIGPVAYETEATYDDSQAEAFGRVGSRLIYDEPERQRRWSVGDVFGDATAFQSLGDIAGAAVIRSPDLIDPSAAVRRQGQRTFVIERASTVDVRVNGQSVRLLRLRPGQYDIRNFPFAAGANQVEILIEDDTGQIQSIRFDFFSDRDLLTTKDQEYAVNIGVPSTIESGSRSYEGEALFSGYYRRGVRDWLTLGVNAQGDADVQQAGAEATFSAVRGLVSADLAASNDHAFGADYAARIDYRLLPIQGDEKRRTLNLSLESLGRRFASLGRTNPDNAYYFTVAAQYSQNITRLWSGGVSLQHNQPRAGRDRSSSVTASASRQFGSLSLFFSVLYDVRGDREQLTGAVSIGRRFGFNQSARLRYDGRDDRWEAGYDYADREGGIGAWGASANATRVDERTSFNVQGQYSAARADLSADHLVLFDEATSELALSRTSARVSGAIGYAQGRAAIGRPVGDSFAILSGHSSLEGRPIRVSPTETGRYQATSGLFGPALARLTSYSTQALTYDVFDLPSGYDLGAAAFVFRPRLHDGYAEMVGSAYNVTVIGELIDGAGEPVALQTADVTSLDDPDKAPVEIFTNRVGRFAASGLAPGRWRIKTKTGRPLDFDLTVPETPDLLFRSGKLSPSENTP